MRRLFLKIFLWYWLATAVVVVVAVVSLHSANPEPERPFWLRDIGNLLHVYGTTAAEIYEHDGEQALARHVDAVEPNETLRAYLFDDTGRELTGRDASARLREAAAVVARSGRTAFPVDAGGLVGAEPVTGPSGRRYVVAARFAGGRPPPPPNTAAVVLRVLAVLLTAGGVCYALALYLVRPVSRLREATQALAGGDLGVRVGSSLGARRDEVADLGRDFDHMAERLEAFVESERRLLRDISHELRSPLARLNVALELVRPYGVPEIQQELDRIELEAGRLDELIGQILTLARLESATLRGANAEVDLARLVEEVATDADFEARARGRRVEVVGAEPCRVAGDAKLLRSAVENVVRNAARYTSEGTAVEISLSTAEGEAVVRVRDHGPGVPDSALERMFRPFFRVADGRERESGGVGLGLAIAERAVRYHHGAISAANAAGGGLEVAIHLPRSG